MFKEDLVFIIVYFGGVPTAKYVDPFVDEHNKCMSGELTCGVSNDMQTDLVSYSMHWTAV